MTSEFTLPTPNVKTPEGCDGLQGHNQAKESDVGMPTNTVLACKNDTTEAEEYQRGFTFKFKSTPQQCNKHAESRGSVLEAKDFSQDPGPHNPIKTMIKYLLFGAGSVPWKGQGKYHTPWPSYYSY